MTTTEPAQPCAPLNGEMALELLDALGRRFSSDRVDSYMLGALSSALEHAGRLDLWAQALGSAERCAERFAQARAERAQQAGARQAGQADA